MVRMKIIIVLLIGTIGSLFAQKNSFSSEYKLVWEDNFNGTTLNSKNWNIEVNGDGGGNQELQYYRKENISLGTEPQSGEGCLIITAKKENYLNKNASSGRLTTQNKVSFKYGKLEARIKLPKTANGLWPAFWLLGADFAKVGWPRSGEIDIMEMGHSDGIKNGTQDRFFNGACHWGYYQPAGWYPNYAVHVTNPYSLQDDFHLFTIVWDPEFIRMYVDQDKYPDTKPYYEIGITDKSSDISTYYYFNKPYFVIFNLAVGGNFTQIWNINQITALQSGKAEMYVDYVKLYQRGDDGEEYTGPQPDLSIGVEPVNKISVYPNPAKDYIEIKGLDDIPFRGKVYNLSGQKVISFSDSNIVDVSSLLSGLYILRIVDNVGKTYSYSLLKD